MLQAERMKMIAEIVDSKGVVDIGELTKLIGASRSTIRRDLYELESMNRIIRAYGGAVSTYYGMADEPPITVRKGANSEEKRRIAQAALRFIKPKETIILDSSTTVNELANLLVDFAELVVISNDLYNVSKLALAENVHVMTIGGALKKGSNAHIGYFSEMFLRQIHANQVFLGVDGINNNGECMIYALDELRLKKYMVAAANEVTVLCDHTKFGHLALVNLCEPQEVDRIITGIEAEGPLLAKIRELGVEVITV